jgi:hypothetical protein
MNVKKLLLSLAAVAAASAWAQGPTPIGTITSVNGVATVTTGTTGAPAGVGTPIVNGARVITTSNATVTLRLNNGCTATLPPGHGVTVVSTMSCQQLTAAIRPVATTVETATVTTTRTVPAGVGIGQPSGAVIAGIAGVIAVGALIAADDDDDAPLSAR